MTPIRKTTPPRGVSLEAAYVLSRLHTENPDQQTILLTMHTALNVLDDLIARDFVVNSTKMVSSRRAWYELSISGKKLARQCHDWCNARDTGAVL